MKRSILAAALAAIVLFPAAMAPTARADDAWDEAAKREIEYFKKYSKKTKDDAKWAELVMGVVGTQHPDAAEELGKLLMRDRNLEHQMILADVLSEFTDKEEAKAAAGDGLLTALDKGKFEIDVIDSIVNSLGKLEYKPACLPICDLLSKGGDPYLLVTAVRAVGNIRDIRALPTLLELWERHPVGFSWETGEVVVDTGAAGTADQEAAEAAWKAKYGNVKKKGKPPVMLKIYIQELAKSVEKIVGEQMESSQHLREWMEREENKARLEEAGVEVPKYKGGTRKPKEEDEKKDGEK